MNRRSPDRAAGRPDPGESVSSAHLATELYAELQRLARSMMSRTPPGQTLQATALVHEAYLRLAPPSDPGWSGRGHFFAAAAMAMRQVLVDQARRKNAVKRGGHIRRVDIDPDVLGLDRSPIDFIALDEALDELAALDERKVNVVMLKFFTGLTNRETADVLGVSEPTVERDWRFAQAFLLERLADAGSAPRGS